MKESLQEYLQKNYKFTDYNAFLKVGKIKLNEADDDPFAAPSDDGGGDAGGDAGGGDPFAAPADGGGDDAGGGDETFGVDDPGAEGGDESEVGGDDSAEDEGADDDSFADHEDDPDFTEGIKTNEEPMLSKVPPGKMVYDVEGVMRSIARVIEVTDKQQLVEIGKVKKALELIFNGKKLNPEDVKFENIQNAMFLIHRIQQGLDYKTKNYMDLKLKQPLIIQRNKNKEDAAAIELETNRISDTIDKLNLKK